MSEVTASPVLWHCSSWADLMPKPKLKADIDAGNLSEGAKTHVEDVFLEEVHGYKKEVDTLPILKGKLCEQDGFAIVKEVVGGEYRKRNLERKTNQYISGLADCVLQKAEWIEDIKISYDLRTYFMADLDKKYEWQGHGYMDLYGRPYYRLVYCLISTPDIMLQAMRQKKFNILGLQHDNPSDEAHNEYLEFCEQLLKNHVFDHIPIEQRVKVFEFERSKEVIEYGYMKARKAQEYYKTLHLQYYQQKLNKQVPETIVPVSETAAAPVEEKQDDRPALL